MSRTRKSKKSMWKHTKAIGSKIAMSKRDLEKANNNYSKVYKADNKAVLKFMNKYRNSGIYGKAEDVKWMQAYNKSKYPSLMVKAQKGVESASKNLNEAKNGRLGYPKAVYKDIKKRLVG